jgi:membrane-associated protein
MLFGVSLPDAIQTVGVVGILAIVFAESGMMVGFFLPGDTLLFTAGFLVQEGALHISMPALVVLIFIAAVLGDNLGYFIGQKFGRRLFRNPHSLILKQEQLDTAERFYGKYGPITVMIARFVPILRTFGPVVAGISNMRYPVFALFDIFGAFAWSVVVTYVGYYGGAFLQAHGIDVESLILPVVGIAALLTFGSPLYHILRDPKSRRAILRRLRLKKDGDQPKAD